MIVAFYSSFFAAVLLGSLILLGNFVRRDWPRVRAALGGNLMPSPEGAVRVPTSRRRRSSNSSSAVIQVLSVDRDFGKRIQR